MKHWIKMATLALVLLIGVALPTEARHRHRHGRHMRRIGITRHVNSANPTPGIPRRVRRGRNLRPGTPRGPIGRTTTVPVFRNHRGHNRDVGDILNRERNRDRDLGQAIGHGAGVRMGRGGGHGRKP